MSDDPVDALRELAGAAGVETEYWDVSGQRRVASPDTLVAVLGAWGAPVQRLADVPGAWAWFHERAAATVLEPVHTIWDAGSLWVRLRLPHTPPPQARATLVSEVGVSIDLGTVDLADAATVDHGGITTFEKWIELTGEWPLGYHTLVVEVGESSFESTVIVAPPTVRGFGSDERSWGVFAPVYSLRDRADLGALDRLSAWLGTTGAGVVGTLPLLAAYLDEPYAPSPYSPVSRRFWNELFADVADLTGGPDRRLVAALHALDGPGNFDYRAQAAVVHDVLAEVAWSADALAGGIDGVPDLMEYARFRAAVTRTGTGWHEWPARQRAGDIQPGDFEPDDAQLHVTAQLVMRRQLLDLAARLAGRGQRLYLDLPVGAHPDGFDTWFEPELFAPGVATGAPPDDFFGEGQNWGFPPISPRAGRDQAHAHFRRCLQHHMEVAGVLRLDHVMGLHRLYWVPDGGSATEGTYVNYPRDELFAVLALESVRNDCIVVGEDLGTVPDEIRHAMQRHQTAGMYVAEFEVPSWEGAEPAAPVHRSVACLDTHDTPTFAGFLHALDVAQRVTAEQLDVDGAHHEFESREQLVSNLRAFLVARGLIAPPYDDVQLLLGALRFLGSSDSACVIVSLEDLWGEVHPQNIPGTPAERPNWVQRFPYTVDQLAGERRVTDALSALDASRRG